MLSASAGNSTSKWKVRFNKENSICNFLAFLARVSFAKVYHRPTGFITCMGGMLKFELCTDSSFACVLRFSVLKTEFCKRQSD